MARRCAMLSHRLIRSLANACGRFLAGIWQEDPPVEGAPKCRASTAERLRRSVQLLEELAARGDLRTLRATEERIIQEELIDLERETAFREFEETLESIASGAGTTKQEGGKTNPLGN